MHLTSHLVNNFTFNVTTSQEYLAQTSQNEWVVDSSYTHHMDKDTSLFPPLDIAIEKRIYVEDEFSLHTIGHGDVSFQRGQIIDMFHVPSLSANLLSISQLTQNGKIVEFIMIDSLLRI